MDSVRRESDHVWNSKKRRVSLYREAIGQKSTHDKKSKKLTCGKEIRNEHMAKNLRAISSSKIR